MYAIYLNCSLQHLDDRTCTDLTYKVKEDEFTNIMVSDVGGERDAVTKLRSPTHYGRPHWDRIFQNVKDKHPDSDVGVFFCGLSLFLAECLCAS